MAGVAIASPFILSRECVHHDRARGDPDASGRHCRRSRAIMTYHRGENAALLTRYGASPGEFDFLIWRDKTA